MRKIRKNDEVIVLTGKDKGKRGEILKVVDEDRVVVKLVNLVKKHKKPNPQTGETGGIIEMEAPIRLSNVAIYNSETKKGDRVGISVLEDGKRVRIFKSTGKQLDSK